MDVALTGSNGFIVAAREIEGELELINGPDRRATPVSVLNSASRTTWCPITIESGRPCRRRRHARPEVSETRVRNRWACRTLSDVFGTMSGMRFGYARVSTTEQNPDSQLDALHAAGCERVFLDKASGKLARRPDWERLDEQLRAGDQVVVTRLSRLARSVRHLTELTAQLHERGVDLVVLHQGIDTSSSAGRFLFHVLAAQDEMLADLISEATREGLAAARARGRVGGRPSVMTPAKLRVARRMLDDGSTVTEVAATLGVGRGTLYRHLGDQARRLPAEPARAAGA